MPGLLPRALGRSARDPSFVVFLLAVVVCLFRARDLPALTPTVGGTELAVTPADLLLAAAGALAALHLWRERRVPSSPLLFAVGAFGLVVLVSAAVNGAQALAAGGKLVLLGALTLGAAAFVDSRERLAALAHVLVGFAALAVLWGVVGFLTSDRERQASFTGEHDLAALATVAAAVGLTWVAAGSGRGAPAAAVLAVGVGGTVLGASLASLIGLYLVVGAVLAVAARRGALRRAAIVAGIAVLALATAGTLAQRQGELGFLTSWFGPPPENPAEPAASLKQRLIFAYVGGRVFLDDPVLGTGWHGELPDEEYARFLPDARDRFPDAPTHYFPPASGTLIPQQAYDQILFELGLVGAAVFAAVGALGVARALRAVRRRDAYASYLPAAWLAAIAGALVGAALFGGSPLTALFWLVLGVVAAEPERS